jgi:hypothetical protein
MYLEEYITDKYLDRKPSKCSRKNQDRIRLSTQNVQSSGAKLKNRKARKKDKKKKRRLNKEIQNAAPTTTPKELLRKEFAEMFNGYMYQSCKSIIAEQINKIGFDTFFQKISNLIANNEFGYVSVKKFKSALGDHIHAKNQNQNMDLAT